MSKEFKFPDVGEGITEGKLVSWKVKVGDVVTEDQTLAEVETDKAVVEIPSPFSGTISKLHNVEGDTLIVGDVIVTFNGEQTTDEPKKTAEPVESAAKPPQTQAISNQNKELPRMAQVPLPPPAHHSTPGGVILAMPAVRKFAKDNNIDLTQIQATGNSGQILITDLDVNSASRKQAPAQKPQTQTVQETKTTPITSESTRAYATHTTVNMGNLLNKTFATPATRRYAQSKGVDIHMVTSADANGRITIDDINKLLGIATPQVTKLTSPTTSTPQSQKANGEEDEVIPLTTTRKIIAKRMRESLDQVAQVTHTEEVDMTSIVTLRNKEKEGLKAKGIRLTYLPFIIKAVLGALRAYPHFNSVLAGENLILKKQYNIGIAVDTPQGLFVPVIHDANTKTIIELSQEIVRLATQTKEKKISPKELTGSTFTITSVGNLGGISFTPIINYPEAAILGVTKIRSEPRVVNNEILVRKVMNICLTFDHRIVDGADAARFCTAIKNYLESPDNLLLGGI